MNLLPPPFEFSPDELAAPPDDMLFGTVCFPLLHRLDGVTRIKVSFDFHQVQLHPFHQLFLLAQLFSGALNSMWWNSLECSHFIQTTNLKHEGQTVRDLFRQSKWCLHICLNRCGSCSKKGLMNIWQQFTKQTVTPGPVIITHGTDWTQQQTIRNLTCFAFFTLLDTHLKMY